MEKIQWLEESHNIVDIIHGVIPYNGLESKIIENAIFSRLHRVLQSSLAYLTYPSNKVHRYEHSIGVMHLSGTFFFHSICNSTNENVQKLINEVGNALSAWLKDDTPKNGLFSGTLADIKKDVKSYIFCSSEEKRTYPDCDLFHKNTPANLRQEQLFVYYVTYEAIRLVGLLHDIGHLPYSHITEFALKRLYREVKTIDEPSLTNKQKKFLDMMSAYLPLSGEETQIHEVIGQKLVEKIFESIREELPTRYNLENLFIISTFFLTKEILKSTSTSNNIFSDLHRIVDGVIDCDRMDYCCRDLYCSGISKEFPRYERIFHTVQIYYKSLPKTENEIIDDREKCCFTFSTKALGQIEALLLRRWEDFTTINYHHSVHKHELLLELVIYQLGDDELKNDLVDPKTEIQNTTVGILPFEISSVWDAIASIQSAGAVDIMISQLDDEWLNTLLKYKYFQKYGTDYSARSLNCNDKEWNRLDELISGQKHYRSLFKRSGGFHRFDNAFYTKYFGRTPDGNSNKYFFDSQLKCFLENNPKYSSAQYYRDVNKELGEWSQTKEAFEKYHIIDCFLDDNDFSPGIKAKDMESIYIISTLSNQSIAPLKERSTIDESIKNQKALFPSFHIYYLPRYDTEHGGYYTVPTEELQNKIAEIMSNHMKCFLPTSENVTNS